MDVVHQNPSSGAGGGLPRQERFLDHEETVVNAGWLWKASKYLGVFRKRFCVLTEQSNLYSFPEPVLDLNTCTDVLNLSQSRTRFVEGDSVIDGLARDVLGDKWQKHIGTGQHFPFMLNLRPRVPTFADFRYIRDITLVAGTAHERERWVKAFASVEPGIELLRSANVPLSGEISPASSFCGDVETVCAICLESFHAGPTLMDEWPETQDVDNVLNSGRAEVVLTGLGVVSPSASEHDASDSGGPAIPLTSDERSFISGEPDVSEAKGAEQREVFQLRCGHTFCRDCIERWASEKRFCPECRAVF